MRIKEAQDKETKLTGDYERLSTEKAHAEAQLKVTQEKTQQNDKGQFFFWLVKYLMKFSNCLSKQTIKPNATDENGQSSEWWIHPNPADWIIH